MEESERRSRTGPPGGRHGGPSDRAALDSALARARAGDEDAFIGLLDWVRPEATNLAARRLRDEEDVADTVQEASLQAWQHIAGFSGDVLKFRAWIMTIVRNACRMLLRKDERQPVVEWLPEPGGEVDVDVDGEVEAEVWELLTDPGPAPDQVLEDEDYMDLLVEAIRGIAEPFATALFLYCWGFTHAEIAGMTKVKLNTVATRLNRARALARDYLRRHVLTDMELATTPRRRHDGARRDER